jgi:hypothetical protein
MENVRWMLNNITIDCLRKMEVIAITEHFTSLEIPDDIQSFCDLLKQQQHFLNLIKNQPTKYVYVLRAIHEMNDENALAALIQQCNEYERIRRDAEHFEIALQHIELIKNAYKIPNANGIKPFYEREMELLNTLHRIDRQGSPLCWRITFVLNAIHCKISNNDICMFDYFTLVDIENYHKWNVDSQKLHAFNAKMTTNEYQNFLNNLILSLKMCNKIHCFADHHTPSNIPSINIADLLLCAIHEQYDENITFAEMNLADRVFYDIYLLKCITSIKFL